MTTFVEIHALQTVPPSCLNRDDSGTPKQAVYGGVSRARVSSQAWKRAVRRHFAETGSVPSGSLTKELPRLVADRVAELDPASSDTAMARAVAAIASVDKGMMEKKTENGADPRLGALMLVSPAQVEALAHVVAAAGDDKPKKTDVIDALDLHHSVDLALFGRMVASAKELSVDGATQVAHAIGVTASDVEFDFYTAVDDNKAARDDSDAGGGMMGTREFTEATLYRYAAVDVDSLTANLAGDTEAATAAVEAFVDGFVRSMPTGSIRSYGNRTLPDTVVVTVRESQPFNVASAFRSPVKPNEGDIMQVATERMIQRLDSYEAKFDLPTRARWEITEDGTTTLAEVLAGVREELSA